MPHAQLEQPRFEQLRSIRPGLPSLRRWSSRLLGLGLALLMPAAQAVTVSLEGQVRNLPVLERELGPDGVLVLLTNLTAGHLWALDVCKRGSSRSVFLKSSVHR